jgi:hypothetical protein
MQREDVFVKSESDGAMAPGIKTYASSAVETDNDKSSDAENEREGANSTSHAKKKTSKDVQERIMTFMGQELQAGRSDVGKQEVAEGCGFSKAGSHSFFYSWQDLERNHQWLAKSGKGCFCLTDLGKDNIPKGVLLAPKKKDNAGTQQFFLKMLLKQCKEATGSKCSLLFEIMADGKSHSLAEFVQATGYANLKSKGLGYPLSYMEKKMKVVEKTGDKKYRFTDKCFPEGRP